MNVLVFLLVLTVLVLIHEAGHFFVAKFFKIKIEEFGFGLPPRALARKIGETVYSINWLPIGGFVKLYGEDEAGAGRLKVPSSKLKALDKSKAFYARSWWQKALVIVAGVVMNFLLAVLITSVLFAVVGVETPGDKVYVQAVVKDSPAESAGIKSGDVIEYINSIKVTSTQQLIDITKKHLGEKLSLKILSRQTEKVVDVTPRVKYPQSQGPMGVGIAQSSEVKKYSWYEAVIAGFKDSLNKAGMLLKASGSLISQIFSTGQVPEYSFAGPVGIAQLTGRYIEFGPAVVLSFVSLLSINLAIINLLPIPGLDGGRLFFILLGAVSRRKISPRIEGYFHTAGIALLYALLLAITFHEITRLLSGQPILPK